MHYSFYLLYTNLIILQYPRASKTLLLIDVNDGICYAYSPGILSPIEVIEDYFACLREDTGISQILPRPFLIKESVIDKITIEAPKEGFLPYSSKGDLDSVEVVATGDLDSNSDWKRIQDSLSKNRWKTVAFRRMIGDSVEMFGLSKNRIREISLPLSESLTSTQLVKRIIKIRDIIERAIASDLRQHAFPEAVIFGS